jgi:hypothetical protein
MLPLVRSLMSMPLVRVSAMAPGRLSRPSRGLYLSRGRYTSRAPRAGDARRWLGAMGQGDGAHDRGGRGKMTIQTFSGSHPFRPACLLSAYRESLGDEFDPDDEYQGIDEVALLVQDIDRGHCPRCGRDFEHDNPAGSRLTPCRCIPVCAECGKAEVFEWEALALIDGPGDVVLTGMVGPVCSWPIDAEGQTLALAELEKRLSVGNPLIETTVGDLEFREQPGGWLEYGHDDTVDRDERER